MSRPEMQNWDRLAEPRCVASSSDHKWCGDAILLGSGGLVLASAHFVGLMVEGDPPRIIGTWPHSGVKSLMSGTVMPLSS